MTKYERYRANGLCVICGKPANEGKSRCEECAKKNRNSVRKNKQSKQARGVCRHCSLLAIPKKRFCMKHYMADKNSDWQKKYRCGFESLLELYHKQGGKCAYSKRPIVIGVDASVDHIVPKSKGGPDVIENYQWVHTRINKMKDNMSHDDFVALCKQIAENN